MLSRLANVFRVPDLRNKVIFTLAIIALYQIGANVPVPGVNWGQLQSLESTAGKAEQIGFYDLVLGDPSAVFRRLDAYRRVSASDVRKAARRYLTQDARTIVRVIPDGGEGDEAEETEEAAQ